MEGKTSVEPEVLGALNPALVYLSQLIKKGTLMLPPPHAWSQLCVFPNHVHQLSLLRVDSAQGAKISQRGLREMEEPTELNWKHQSKYHDDNVSPTHIDLKLPLS